MPRSFSEILQAIRKPLSYAAKNDYAQLSAVKGLDALIPALARAAHGCSANTDAQAVMSKLERDFADFDACDPEVQRTIIADALHTLQTLDAACADRAATAPAAPVPQHAAPDITHTLQELSRPVTDVSGIGPKLAEALSRMQISTVEDLLYLLPRTYLDRRRVQTISQIEPGCQAVVIGKVLDTGRIQFSGRKKLFELIIGDGTAVIAAKWFRLSGSYAALLKKKFSAGDEVIMTGQVTSFRYRLEMHHPEIELLADDEDVHGRLMITPVYPLTEGVPQKTMQRIMRAVARRYPALLGDYLPPDLRAALGLVDISTAFSHVHTPQNADDIDKLTGCASAYHRRIVFDEFFLLQTVLALRKRGVSVEPGISHALDDGALDLLIAALPFQLTAAQRTALDEIRTDMAAGAPMNRLLQGDVGSGKTVVSLLAARIAIHNGCQAAIMAPTEVLAGQHFKTITTLVTGDDIRIAMLSGSQPRPVREAALAAVRCGDAQLVIGTHALIQESVVFHRLGLVVVDEQHKFGVLQRAAFKKKGTAPDMLVMTATPIPRTLGLTVYGDLDVSIIRELPPGRNPVTTKVYSESRRNKVYALIGEVVAQGNQAFIIYPLVEASEKSDLMDATRMAAHLQQDVFADCRVGLVHGRMSSEEKNTVMQAFSAGELQILVATTVVEVGIDVPNAALMVIEHAERFGLSQLHQLRGRVGRGAARSTCVLLAQFTRSDDARKRLAVMEQTCDGFKIAEEDFTIRGPGDFLGTRQSGLPDFRVAHIGRDIGILIEARKAAFRLIEKDPHLQRSEHQALKKILLARWKGRFELAGIA